MNDFKKFLFFLFFLSFLFSSAYADSINISKIEITGNKSISNESILSIAGIKKEIFKTDTDTLNIIQKKLFESNFFKNIEIIINKNTLKISVEENPIVEYFLLEGLDDNSNFKKDIEKIIYLKDNVIFSESYLNKDLLLIKSYLFSQGYLNSSVKYKVNKIDNSRVNIFYEIILNNKFFVKNIYFIGDKKFSSSELLDIISTSQDNIFSFFSSTSVPSEDRLNYDLTLLKNFYLSEGYYDIQIPNASIIPLDDKFVNIFFSINAGQKFIIDSYIINNNLITVDDKDSLFIKNNINLLVKNKYNPDEIIKVRNILTDYLSNIGINANVDFSIKKVSDNNLSVIFDINEILDKQYVKSITVTGNDITEEKVIRNNIYFSEGDLLSNLKIKKSKDLLQSLGYIDKIQIIVENVNDTKNLDIKIKVEEKPSGEISGGIGLASSEFSIAFNLSEKNFLGRGINTDIGLNLGTQQVLANIFFSNPDFNDSGNTLSNSFYVSKFNYDTAGYENKILGDLVSTKYRIFQDIDFENGFGVSVDSVEAKSSASNLIKSQEGDFFTTKYFYNFYNDKRNRKFRPTEGYTVGFGQDISFPPSDIPFVSNSFFGSYYKQLKTDFTGSIKYRFKSINSLNSKSVKLSDRFFNSDMDLRGFAYRGVGPKVDSDFIGGNYSLLSTFNSTIPNGLPDKWNASTNIFLDIGNVWGSDINNVGDYSKIRSSIGAGFTWISPIGPLSISYAEPISKMKSDKVEKFNFRLGGAF